MARSTSATACSGATNTGAMAGATAARYLVFRACNTSKTSCPLFPCVATPDRLLSYLRDGAQTAQQLARKAGLDPSSARRHLEMLAAAGHVERDDRRQGRGRPRRHYRLSQQGWETFPRDYAYLLEAMLAKVGAQAGREAVLDAFGAIADDLAASVPSGPDRAEGLCRMYNDLGFEASLERGEATTLVQRNCPFLRAARADPEALCDCLDEGIIRRALPGARVELVSCLATGDAQCRHRIEETP